MRREGTDERAVLGLAGLGLVGLAAFFLLLGERDPPGGVVTGRVLTTDGRMPWRDDWYPRIVARWDDPVTGRYGSAETQIAFDGRYRIVGLPKGVDLELRLSFWLAMSVGCINPPRDTLCERAQPAWTSSSARGSRFRGAV